MGTLIMKFGGSAIGTTAALTQVVSIILQEYERWDRLIVVVSALGGVTDALLEAAHLAQLSNRRGYRRIVATIRTRHLALVDQLSLGQNERSVLQADIDRLLFEMLDICQTVADGAVEETPPETIDAIIGVGERMAARIIAALVRESGLRGVAIDTTDLLITDDTYGNAVPNMIETRARIEEHLIPMVERGIIPVITGFIAGTLAGNPTTLGRGGSDYTASILGVCTGTDEVWMWTDVDGMMSADPHEIDEAVVIPELSYDEVAELAYFGARILHARMIDPIREQSIPLRIKNVFKPQQPGTLVHNIASNPAQHIKAVTRIQGIGLTARHSGPLSEIAALVNEVLFTTIGSHADVMISAQSSSQSFVCFVIPTSAGPDALHTTQRALKETLEEQLLDPSWHVLPVSLVTAIGTALDSSPRIMATIFDSLDDIHILALAQGPSHCSLSIVVGPEDADEALHRVHQLTLNTD